MEEFKRKGLVSGGVEMHKFFIMYEALEMNR